MIIFLYGCSEINIAVAAKSEPVAVTCTANFTAALHALPADLFDELLVAVGVLKDMRTQTELLMDGKLLTFWFDTKNKQPHDMLLKKLSTISSRIFNQSKNVEALSGQNGGYRIRQLPRVSISTTTRMKGWLQSNDV